MGAIDEQQIKALAYRISQMHKSYQELCWRLAEVELILEMGQTPDPDITRQIAQNISDQKIPTEKLHWYLAEKILLAEKKWGIHLTP